MIIVVAFVQLNETQNQVTTLKESLKHHLLVLQGHMMEFWMEFFFHTDATVRQFSFSELHTNTEVVSVLGSCNDESVHWLQNKKKHYFPSEQKRCTKCHFKSTIYILKGVWCFPRIVE